MGKKSKIKTFLSKLGKKKVIKYEEQSANGFDDSYESDTHSIVDKFTSQNSKRDYPIQEDDQEECQNETEVSLSVSFEGCLIDESGDDLLAQIGTGDTHGTEFEEIPYIDDAELGGDISLDLQDPETFSRFFHMHNGELIYDEDMPVDNSPGNRRPLMIPHPGEENALIAKLGRAGGSNDNDEESKENRGDAHWKSPKGYSFIEARKRQLLTHSGQTHDECSAARIGKFVSFPQNGNLPRPVPINPNTFVNNMKLATGRIGSRKDSEDKDDKLKNSTMKPELKPKRSKSNKQLVNRIQSEMQRTAGNHSAGMVTDKAVPGVSVRSNDIDGDALPKSTQNTRTLVNVVHKRENEIITSADNPKEKKETVHTDLVRPVKQDLPPKVAELKKITDKAESTAKPSRIPRKKSSNIETVSNVRSGSSEKVTKKKRKTDLMQPSKESVDERSSKGDKPMDMSDSFNIGPPLATSTGQKKKSGKPTKPEKVIADCHGMNGDKRKRRKDQHHMTDEDKSNLTNNPETITNHPVLQSDSMELHYSENKEKSTDIVSNHSTTLAVVEPQISPEKREASKTSIARPRRRRRFKDGSHKESSNEATSPLSSMPAFSNTEYSNIEHPSQHLSCDNNKTETSNACNSSSQDSSVTLAQRNVTTPIIHYHVTLQNCDGININVNRNDPTVGIVPGAIEVNNNGQGHLQQLNWTETIDDGIPIGSVPFGPLITSSESWSETSTNSTIIAGHGDYEVNQPVSQQTKYLTSETNTTLLATTEVNFDETCSVSDVTCDTTYLVDADAWGCKGVNESCEHFSVCGHHNMDKRASTKSLQETKSKERSSFQALDQSGQNNVSKSVPYRLNRFGNKPTAAASPGSKTKEFSPPWRSQSTTSTSSNSSSTCDDNCKEKVTNGHNEKGKSSSNSLGEKLKSVLSRSKSNETSESMPKINKDNKQSAHSRLFHNLLNPSKHKEHSSTGKAKKQDGNVKPQTKELQDAANNQILHSNEQSETNHLPSSNGESSASIRGRTSDKPSNKGSGNKCNGEVSSGTPEVQPTSVAGNINFDERAMLASNTTSEDSNVVPLAEAATDEPCESAQSVRPKTQQSTGSNRPILMPHSGNHSPKPVAKVMPMTRTTDSSGRTVTGTRTLLQGYTFRFAGNATTSSEISTPSIAGVTIQTPTAVSSSAFSSYVSPSAMSAMPQPSVTITTTTTTTSATLSIETPQSQYSSYTSTTYSNAHVGSSGYSLSTSRQYSQASTTSASSVPSSYESYNTATFAPVHSTTSRSTPVTSILSPSEQVLLQSSPFSRSDVRRRTTRTLASPHVIISSSRTTSRASARSSLRLLHSSPSETSAPLSRPTSRVSRTTPSSEVYISGRTSRVETAYAAQESTDDDDDDDITESTLTLLESSGNFVDVDEDIDANSTTFRRYGLGSTIQPTMIRRRGGPRERGTSSHRRAPTLEERVSSLRDTIVRVPGVLILSTRRNRMVVYLSQDRPNIEGVFQFMQEQGVGRSEYEVEILPWGHRGAIGGVSNRTS